jgi:hypothetical protein
MAQPLTWRDVAAPDFSGAQRGQAQAIALLNQALGTAGTGLAEFDNTQSNIVNQEAQRQLLKYQDPAELQAALKSGALFAGLDPARIRQTTMNDANNRVGNLLSTATATENLAQGTLNNQFTNAERLRELDARLPAAAALARASGVPMGDFANLPIAAQSQLVGDISGKTRAAFDNSKVYLNADEEKRSTSLMQGFQDQGLGPTAIRKQLESSNVSPAVRARIGSMYKTVTGKDLTGPNADIDKFEQAMGGPVPAGERPSTGAAWASAVGLTKNESGGKTTAENSAVGSGGKVGHFGLLQFGQDRLADAKKAGVLPADMTPQQYRDSTAEVQNKVADWHFADIDNQATKLGLDTSFGKTVNGVVIDRDAVRGMAHLGGIAGVKRFIETNGKYDPADANGTKISDYGKKFGGGGVGVPAETQLADFRPSTPVGGPLVNTLVPQPAGPVLTGTNADRIPGNNGPVVPAVATAPAIYNGDGYKNSRVAGGISSLLSTFGVNPTEKATAVGQPATAGGLISNAAAGTLPVGTPPLTKTEAKTLPPVESAAMASTLVQSLAMQATQDVSSADLTSISQNLEAFKNQAGAKGDMVAALMKLPTFAGANSGLVDKYVTKISQEANVSPKVAAAALQHVASTDAYMAGSNWLFNGTDGTEDLGGKVVVREDALKNIIQLVKDNREVGNLQLNNQMKGAQVVSMNNKATKMKELEDLIKEQRTRVDAGFPNSSGRLAAMQKELDDQKKAFTETFGKIQSERPRK